MASTVLELIEARVERVPFSGCWIWMGYVDAKGYGRMSVPGAPGARCYRLAWEATNRRLEFGECVLHRCDVPACCNPQHLFVGSLKDNNIDKARKGRGNRKLAFDDVHSIRADRRAHLEIAEQYGVSRSMVSLIKSKKQRIFV